MHLIHCRKCNPFSTSLPSTQLKGLPVRKGTDCVSNGKAAEMMGKISREMRTAMKGRRTSSAEVSQSAAIRRDELMVSLVKNSKWDDETKVPTLVQIFQAENAPVRKQVVEQLAALKGEKASAALAQRAIFDLSPEVRQPAVAALKDRPIAEFRSALLGGMRYPWVPVAEHAAEAFVALKDRESALSLAPLLDLPNPMAPVREKENKWTVTEVVRINHLRNCLMCHAPSFNRQEPIRGLVPEKGQPLAEVYYESQRGTFVRADVVYLKQDFSITQTVLNAQPWPERQRFDYLVRKRELSKKEIEEIGAADKERSVGEDHHRAAAPWALRQLTGKDAGQRSEDWYRELRATSGKAP